MKSSGGILKEGLKVIHPKVIEKCSCEFYEIFRAIVL